MCSVKPQNDLSHKGQAVEEWADLHFFRPIGIRIARALQPTGISADQVTLWSLVIGLVAGQDRKSTRLNSSHLVISYAVFCLKKKTNIRTSKSRWQCCYNRLGCYRLPDLHLSVADRTNIPTAASVRVISCPMSGRHQPTHSRT